MALLGAYEDSGGRESYPRARRVSVEGAASPVPSGGTAGPAPVPAPTPDPTPAPPAPAPQQYGLTGFDSTKLADPNHNTFKYQYGRIAQGYDPTKGVQSGMLDDLNKLGYAQFYGQGQQLGWKGVTDAGKAAGMDPYDFSGDFIQGWQNGQNPNALWQYDWREDPNAQQATTPDLSQLFAGLFQQQPQQPAINITNSGIDPAALQALLETYQPQTQYVAAPGYQPSAPQTQAPPMAAGAPAAGGSVQTQSAGPQAQPGMDPFMAWLRSQVFGGQQ